MNSNYYDILSSPTIELSTEIVTESEKLAIVISDQNDSPYGVTVAQTVKPLSLSLESTQVYRLLSKVDVQERIPRPQFKHILPVIKQKTEEKLVLNLQEPFSNSVDPQTRQSQILFFFAGNYNSLVNCYANKFDTYAFLPIQ